MFTFKQTATAILGLHCYLSATAIAGGVAQHSNDALRHSGQAVQNVSVAGVKLVSGVVAAPLLVSGEVGQVSGQMGEALWQEADDPLPVTHDVITVGPSPAQAMEQEVPE